MILQTFSLAISSETLEIRPVLLYGVCSPSSAFQRSQNASRGSPCDSMAFLLYFWTLHISVSTPQLNSTQVYGNT